MAELNTLNDVLRIGIEKEEAYIKIGLRRLHIQQDYQGEILTPPVKNFQRK